MYYPEVLDKIKKDESYIFQGWEIQILIKIMSKLYDESKPLLLDEKRDMANAMYLLFSNADRREIK